MQINQYHQTINTPQSVKSKLMCFYCIATLTEVQIWQAINPLFHIVIVNILFFWLSISYTLKALLSIDGIDLWVKSIPSILIAQYSPWVKGNHIYWWLIHNVTIMKCCNFNREVGILKEYMSITRCTQTCFMYWVLWKRLGNWTVLLVKKRK